ncbi:hypothetical protein BaRGS_00012371 [Batillaria attramentaria]|uniref:Uncharacterized protein n=1 Tax=Batillaria attramentaria TaxID=370345 RepID=A0ABD0LBD5_9CAEN
MAITCVLSGHTPGHGDVLPFQNVPVVPSHTYSVTSDVTSTLVDVTRPFKLYVSVRCYNRAGLPTTATTDGVTIVNIDDVSRMRALRMFSDGMTQYPVQESCHLATDQLRMRWDNVAAQIPVAGFEVMKTDL